ncbi:NAD(P)H-hydrate dehydratase [Stakelama saccharophila]|uniref:ADP-dependent (S)-NAD(P)H-hydrate dehydratase n=1 Tax=Stakelama saccharophila TaxID=3075605 RepID=A0ABZ0B516_9SPHN|nr:NAD(P)H-hydrate dehydratase [Stakelama sp. W311]WNO52477.1 NAD(P)H-hydrate dehydratase [Stakelama sp. W311]
MRTAEQRCFDAGIDQATLMERAGTAVAREAMRFALGRPVLVLAGPGNNGGDAYAAARLLHSWGCDVTVAALGSKKSGAAADMRRRWTGPTVALADAAPRAVLVDGLFGTGMSRPLETDVREALHRLVGAADFSLAIDLPSGLATDSGEDLGLAPVSATCALGALKPAHVLMPGAACCGHVRLVDIDIACPDSTRTIARPRLTPPARDAHKYRRGMVAVVAGAMPGAAHLAARATLHAGAGYVLLASGDPQHRSPDALVRRKIADADDLAELLADARIGAAVIGPGLGSGNHARALLDAALASDRPLIIDGDALTLLGEDAVRRLSTRDARSWLTPHEGEFVRLFGDGGGNKIDRTRQAAQRAGATIVHKGPDTVIADPDGNVHIADTGTSWLSTAGTGDVLAGICGARMACGDESAADAAIWLHARAARLTGAAFMADDIVAPIASAVAECL